MIQSKLSSHPLPQREFFGRSYWEKPPLAHFRLKLSRESISLAPIVTSEPESPNLVAISTALSDLLTTELFKWNVEQLDLPDTALADCEITFNLLQFPPKDENWNAVY